MDLREIKTIAGDFRNHPRFIIASENPNNDLCWFRIVNIGNKFVTISTISQIVKLPPSDITGVK